MLIELMEGVEDIPGAALHEGVPWGAWESFPEYLDFLGQRSYSLDIGAQLAHGVRKYGGRILLGMAGCVMLWSANHLLRRGTTAASTT